MTDSDCTPESVPVVDRQFICIHESNIMFSNVNCECNRTKGYYGDPLDCKRIKEACGVGLELKCDGMCKDCEAGYHKPYSNMGNNLCQWLQTSFDKTSTTSLSSLVTQDNTSTTTAPQTGSGSQIKLGVIIGVPLAIIFLISVVVVVACILKRRRRNSETQARIVHYAGHNSHNGMESQVLIENGNGVLRPEDQAASPTYLLFSSVNHTGSYNEQQQLGSTREVQDILHNIEGDGHHSHSGEHHRNGGEHHSSGGEHHSSGGEHQNHGEHQSHDGEHHSNVGEHHSNVGEHHSNVGEHHSNVGEHHSNVGEHHSNIGEHHSNGGEHHSNVGEHHSNVGEHHSDGSEHHSNGSEHHSNGGEHHSNVGEHHSNGSEHHSNVGEHHSNDGEHHSNIGEHHSHGDEHQNNDDEHHSNGDEHQNNGHIRDQQTDGRVPKPVQRVPPMQQVNAQQKAQAMAPTPVPVVSEMPPTPVPVTHEIPLEPVFLGSAPPLNSLIDEREEVEDF